MHLLLINGSLHGRAGNTHHYLRECERLLERTGDQGHLISLAEDPLPEAVRLTREAKAIIIGTGTYWDSWGSPLQQYLELLSEYDADQALIGKPVGVIITMDSVGGTGLMFRLQGALASMGFLVPPLSGVVLSRVAAMATHDSTILPAGFDPPNDVWCPEDIKVMLHNVLEASGLEATWGSWPVAKTLEPLWPKDSL